MGTWLKNRQKLVKISILSALFILSISVQVFAADDPQPTDDGTGSPSTEDTDFARSAISKIQI